MDGIKFKSNFVMFDLLGSVKSSLMEDLTDGVQYL